MRAAGGERWRGGGAWALVGLVALAACAEPAPRQGEASVRRPNLVLISIDTLRADHLGCYGYERPTSPNLDLLASAGVLFERATANSPWTLPSHASMLTGLYPKHHGLTKNAALLGESVPTLAELLGAQGYATLGLTSSIFVSERNGLHRGFERFRRELKGDRVSDATYAVTQVEQAITWLDDLDGSPFFLFWHNYDLHSNYTPAPRFLAPLARQLDSKVDGSTRQLQQFRRGKIELSSDDFARLSDLYDAEILELDTEIGRFLAYLRESGRAQDTILVVTSDHGEELGEHGGVLHGRTLYEEILHVPLIVAGPGVPAGRRVEGLVQLSDLFATLLDLAGVEAPPGDGASLVPAWEGERGSSGRLPGRSPGRLPGRFPGAERLSFAEADHRGEEHDVKRAVRLGDWKLLFDRSTGEHQLFDLGRDPGEHEDLTDAQPEVSGRLLDALERYLAEPGAAAAERVLSESEIETLRSLGYVE